MYAGVNDFSNLPSATHVKIVGAMRYAAIFPAYSVGVGTTAAGLPTGVPTLGLPGYVRSAGGSVHQSSESGCRRMVLSTRLGTCSRVPVTGTGRRLADLLEFFGRLNRVGATGGGISRGTAAP